MKEEEFLREGTEMTLEDVLKKNNITEEQLLSAIEMVKHPQKEAYQSHNVNLNDKKFYIGVISDTHIGHKMYRPDIMDCAAKEFNKYHVDFVLHPGDILEGMSGREGHIFELNEIGATNQIRRAKEELSKIRQPIYAITASQSHDGWFSSKGNAGFEVGPALEKILDNFHFLGYDEADLNLDNGCKIRMTHPGDGTAYAISYKLQKYINSISGGQKPSLLFQGHYHKAMYMMYRNIHAFDAGTLCAQTIFMKKKMTPAMLGYWIVGVQTNKNGNVSSVTPKFRAFYE